jgi:hypothetical protein
MTIETGLLERAYVQEETTYGEAIPGDPSATDAFRHLELTLDRKLQREPSPEKRGTPDRYQSLPRRSVASWELGSALWEPSGTLGTASYLARFLKNGLGAQTTPALATTVAATPAPTATGCTLTSATGLAVGDTIVFTVASGARREITRIKSISGNAITYDQLSAAPDAPGAAVSGVNYKLAASHPGSLRIFKFHTAGGFKEAVTGAIVTKIQVSFDGSREVGIQMSGPAKTRVRTGFNAPAGFTTVGEPASGLVGNLYVDGSAFLVLSATITLENKSELRNAELGTDLASGIIHHPDFRDVKVSLSFYLEDTTLIQKAEQVQKAVLRLLVGNANGKMVGAVLPAVEFEIPSIPAGSGPKVVTIEGVAYDDGSGNATLVLGEH